MSGGDTPPFAHFFASLLFFGTTLYPPFLRPLFSFSSVRKRRGWSRRLRGFFPLDMFTESEEKKGGGETIFAEEPEFGDIYPYPFLSFELS